MISFEYENWLDDYGYDWMQIHENIYIKIVKKQIIFYNFQRQQQEQLNFREAYNVKKIQSKQNIIQIAIISEKMIKICNVDISNLQIRIKKTTYFKDLQVFQSFPNKFNISIINSRNISDYQACFQSKVIKKCKWDKVTYAMEQFQFQFIKFRFFDQFRHQVPYITQVFQKIDFLREYFQLSAISITELIKQLQVKNNFILLKPYLLDQKCCAVNYDFYYTRNGLANWFKLRFNDQLIDITIISNRFYVLVQRDLMLQVFMIIGGKLKNGPLLLTFKKAPEEKVYFYENNLVHIQKGYCKSYKLGE